MNGLGYFFQLVLIAIVLVWAKERFLSPRGRAWFDRIANRNVNSLRYVTQIANLGSDLPVTGPMGVERFEAAMGLKLVAGIGTVLLLWLIFPGQSIQAPDGMNVIGAEFLTGPYAMLQWVLIVFIGFYYVFYIWSYRVELSGCTLSYRDLLLRPKRWDLRYLVRIEDDGAYALRLYFKDGSRGEIMKHVKGRQTLERRLAMFEAATAPRPDA